MVVVYNTLVIVLRLVLVCGSVVCFLSIFGQQNCRNVSWSYNVNCTGQLHEQWGGRGKGKDANGQEGKSKSGKRNKKGKGNAKRNQEHELPTASKV